MKLFALTLASFSLLASAPVLADPTRLREDVRAVAPALEKYALGTLLGDVWKRPGLSLRDRSIVTLAALITRNQTAEMADYLNLALDNGVKPAEVSETITHLAFYSGWGNAHVRGCGRQGCLRRAQDHTRPACSRFAEPSGAQRGRRSGSRQACW